MNIKKFGELSVKNIEEAGGKGASLGEMTRAKIPVPPGFVVLSAAFSKFIKDTDLESEIDAIWDKINVKDVESIEEQSEIIRHAIKLRKFPKELGEEILKSFDQLGARYVAVRSSATAEDSQVDAWAGQLDSYLYVERSSLLDHVQKCWASLFTPRAIFYRVERKLVDNDVSVAVVIQKMVQSEVSGVCFTVHPVTKDKDQLIIEACWGLGESLVQGTITPDSYVIEKSTLRLVDINVSAQKTQIVKAAKLVKTVSVSQNKKNKQKLSEKYIKQLTKIAIGIEKHYKKPMDIEWALEKGKLYIVQARPITTL